MNTLTAKTTLLVLAGLFIVPLALAWLMYSGVIDYLPKATTNRGSLIQPPVKADFPGEFNRLDLIEHWMLVYPLPLVCGDRCYEDLSGLHKVQRALGRDANRLRTVLLAEKAPGDNFVAEVEAIDATLVVITDETGKLARQFEKLAGRRGVYMIDPLGHIMMHYPSGSDPNDIRLDVKRLLRYTKTDPQ